MDKKYPKRGMDSGYMGMISEDHSAVANMPQNVVQKTYPKTAFTSRYELDDTIKGVDDNLSSGVRKMDAHPSKSMY